jgi:hypothetical protein
MKENEEKKTNTGTLGMRRKKTVSVAGVVVTLILSMSKGSTEAAWLNGLMSPVAGLALEGF